MLKKGDFEKNLFFLFFLRKSLAIYSAIYYNSLTLNKTHHMEVAMDKERKQIIEEDLEDMLEYYGMVEPEDEMTMNGMSWSDFI